MNSEHRATTTGRSSHVVKSFWLAYGAALWALIFAVLHALWAMGWYVGLKAEKAHQAFQATWMLVYDLIIVGLCVFGFFLALAFVQSWGRTLPRGALLFVGWCATGLLILRSGGSLIQIFYFLVIGRLGVMWQPMLLWEFWFYVGTGLFGLSFCQFRRTSGFGSSTPCRPSPGS